MWKGTKLYFIVLVITHIILTIAVTIDEYGIKGNSILLIYSLLEAVEFRHPALTY